MNKILKIFKIIQIQYNKNTLGHTYTKRRLNPYNPLTYLVILLSFMIGVILFGVVGFWSQVDLRDLKFKYR